MTCFNTITALEILLHKYDVRYGDSVYRQVFGIPIGINCAPLNHDKHQQRPIETILIQKSYDTLRYLKDILALNNDDFSIYTEEIYSAELTLNKAITNNEHCPFLDRDIYDFKGKLNNKIYDKRYDFSFPIVDYSFLDGDVPLILIYCVYISCSIHSYM